MAQFNAAYMAKYPQWDAGKRAFAAEKFEEAFFNFTECIASEPKYSEVFKWRGRAYMGMGKFKEALYDFSVAIQLEKRLDDQADKKKMSDAYCYAGQCHFEMEQYDLALAHQEKACTYERENGRNLFYRALSKSKLANGVKQKYEDANEDFKSAFKEFQNDVTSKYFIRFNMGINLRLIGKYEESADMLRQAVELQPNRPGAYNNLGLTCIEMGEFAEAIAHFEKAIKLEPLAAIYVNNLGLGYYNSGQYRDAINQFKVAKKINMDRDMPFEDPTLAFNLANVFLTQGQFHAALDSYQEAIQIEDMNPKYWHHKGIVYEAMIKALEDEHGPQLVKIKSVKHKKRAHLDKVFMQVQEYVDCALSTFSHVIQNVKEDHFESRYHLAMLLHQTYNFGDSLQHFKKAAALHAKDHTVLLQLAIVYFDLGDYDKCIEHIETALAEQPNYVDALFYMGMAKLKNKQVIEAKSFFKQAIDLNDLPKIQDGLGQCHHELKEYEESIYYLDEAIKKEGNNV